MQHNEYNGWTNYETWAVNLWISNDEGSQAHYDELARDLLSEDDDPEDEGDRVCALADAIKEAHEEGAEACGTSGVFADLIGAALSEVNWHEIAEPLIEAARESVPYAAKSEDA